jgi:hypothetical protein
MTTEPIIYRSWTQEQIDFLKENYNAFTSKQLADRFGKTIRAVLNKAFALEITGEKYSLSRYRENRGAAKGYKIVRWTSQQVEFLKANYSTMPMADLVSNIGKDAMQIRNKAWGLKITRCRFNVDAKHKGKGRPSWSREDLAYLNAHYRDTAIKDLQGPLRRSYGAIQAQAQRLGLQRKVANWTPEEEQYLKEKFSNTPIPEMVRHLKRTWRAIMGHAHYMKLGGTRRSYATKNAVRAERVKVAKQPPVKITHVNERKIKLIRATARPKKKEKCFPTKHFDPSEKKAVRIDRRTTIYVPLSATPEQVEQIISRYQKNNNQKLIA